MDPNRLLPGTRWGCRDGDRLEAYPTMVTGGKPTLRWRQAGSLSHDGDRLEAYPTVGVPRWRQAGSLSHGCGASLSGLQNWELTEDLSLAMDVIP